jgi:hypothetical protein
LVTLLMLPARVLRALIFIASPLAKITLRRWF